jgi:aflatoxin B1 aldehyde reductase
VQAIWAFNCTADEVERIVAICREKPYVAPTVRSGENTLFPVLRKNGIAFYAYSPAAAGVFVGSHKKCSVWRSVRFLGE